MATDLSNVSLVALTGTLDRVGGAERAFRRIVDEFEARLGMNVVLVSHLPPQDADLAERTTVLRPEGRPAGPRMVMRMRKAITAVDRPAILFGFQINSNVVAAVANASLCRRRRLPIVLNDRAAIAEKTQSPPGSGLVQRMRTAVFREIVRLCYRRADCVVCNARANADAVRSFIAPREVPVETVYNPLEATAIQARFAERDRRSILVPGRPLVVGHGRLHAKKGWDTLLKAFAEVRAEWPGALLRIVGEGPERAAIEALADELGLAGSLDLPGFSAEPLSSIAEGDVYVLPSRFEGLPNSLLEAIALGLPTIAADCPTGPSEILSPDGDAGLLFRVDDVGELADHLRVLLRDGERRVSMGQSGRRRALDFSPAVNAEAYAAVFRRVLGRSLA